MASPRASPRDCGTVVASHPIDSNALYDALQLHRCSLGQLRLEEGRPCRHAHTTRTPVDRRRSSAAACVLAARRHHITEARRHERPPRRACPRPSQLEERQPPPPPPNRCSRPTSTPMAYARPDRAPRRHRSPAPSSTATSIVRRHHQQRCCACRMSPPSQLPRRKCSASITLVSGPLQPRATRSTISIHQVAEHLERPLVKTYGPDGRHTAHPRP